jgi:hypothetical protein
VADEHCRDGREVGAAHRNQLIAAGRTAAGGVGGVVIDHGKRGAGLGREVDLVGVVVRAALNQSGLAREISADRIGCQSDVHQRQG